MDKKVDRCVYCSNCKPCYRVKPLKVAKESCNDEHPEFSAEPAFFKGGSFRIVIFPAGVKIAFPDINSHISGGNCYPDPGVDPFAYKEEGCNNEYEEGAA